MTHTTALVREPWLPRRALLCGVALCHAFAFASLHAQLPGLLGADGVLPIASVLRAAEARAGGRAAPLSVRLRALPTLLWLHAPLGAQPDALAGLVCLLGAGLAGALASFCACRRLPGGAVTAMAFGVLHALYLSLLQVGQAFLSFQWDILLLEVTVLAALLAAIPPAFAWPARMTLFKLMLMSGAVKLQSGCPTWSSLTALDFHFATQPLPTPLAWHAAKLPRGALRLGVAVALALEGPAAFLLLCPLRGARAFGALLQVGFQLGIAATGNYTFFNLLTLLLALACMPAPGRRGSGAERAASAVLALGCVAVCASCFTLGPPGARLERMRLTLSAEDMTAALGVVLPATMRALFWLVLPAEALRGCAAAWRGGKARVPRVAAAAASSLAAAALCALTAAPMATLLPPMQAAAFHASLPPLPSALRDVASVAHASSGYGLFRAMTGVGPRGAVARPELQLQGRNASATESGDSALGWRDVPFRFKPSPPGVPRHAATPPRWVAPHQPRLDWQMWFAALGDPNSAPWAVHLVALLLRGSPDAWALLAPPREVGGFSARNPPAELRVLTWRMAFAPAGDDAWWVAADAASPHEWLPPLRASPELDAWLTSRGWAPPKKGRRHAKLRGRLAWARGGQAWAAASAAAAGTVGAAAAVAAGARDRADTPHSKPD